MFGDRAYNPTLSCRHRTATSTQLEMETIFVEDKADLLERFGPAIR
ncbi:MAG: hypothetical protein GY788_14985 [bacterium]|nr:hypothetical protein [bacterium]